MSVKEVFSITFLFIVGTPKAPIMMAHMFVIQCYRCHLVTWSGHSVLEVSWCIFKSCNNSGATDIPVLRSLVPFAIIMSTQI